MFTKIPIEMEDARLGRYMMAGRIVIVLLVLVMGGWAAAASIGGAVIAAGTLTVESTAKSVQHLEGGIVQEIAVRDGDRVAAGDLLVRLRTADLVEEIDGLKAQVGAKREEARLVAEELRGLRQLHRQGLVPNTRIVALERDAARLAGETGQLVARISQASARVQRADIRSPITGTVHDLNIHTVGGVIRAGNEVLKIVPSGDLLIVEARLRPRDIDQVRRGQSASVRLSALNLQDTPALDAEVIHVSPDLVRDERHDRAYYMVRLAFSEGASATLPSGTLVPGMPVDVFIKTAARSALSYLVKPLTDQMTRAFREQ